MMPPNSAPTTPRVDTSCPREIKAANRGPGPEAANGETLRPRGEPIDLSVTIVHEVAGSDWRGQLRVPDVANNRRHLHAAAPKATASQLRSRLHAASIALLPSAQMAHTVPSS